MCVGIPMQVLSSDGIAASATDGSEIHLIDLSLTGPVAPGSWVLTFLGSATQMLDADEAARIRAALAALKDIMAGGTGAGGFDDIDARGPQLPPHLAAALAAGQTTG